MYTKNLTLFRLISLATTLLGYSVFGKSLDDSSFFAHSIMVSNLCPNEIHCKHIQKLQDPVSDLRGLLEPPVQLNQTWKAVFQALSLDTEVVLQCAKTSDMSKPVELKWIYNNSTEAPRIEWRAFLQNGQHANPFINDGFMIQNFNTSFSQPPPQDTIWRSCWDVWCPAGRECDGLQVDWRNDDGSERESAYPVRVCPDTDFLLWTICGVCNDQPQAVEDRASPAAVD